MNVQEFLNHKQVAYEAIHHRPTFDAQHLAQAVKETGYHVAKSVLLKSGSEFVLAVVPATHSIDLADTRVQLRSEDLSLASESEVAEHFPDCEIGAIPPFGSQYGLKTLLDNSFEVSEAIVFESNTHEDAIRMRYADYVELEKPVVMELSRP